MFIYGCGWRPIFIILFYFLKNIFQLLEPKIRFKSIPCEREKIEFKIGVQKLDLTKVQTPREEEIAWTKIIYKRFMIQGSKSTYAIARSNNVLFQIVYQGVLKVADFDTKSRS